MSRKQDQGAELRELPKMADIAEQLQNLNLQMSSFNTKQDSMMKSMGSLETKLDQLTRDSTKHDEILNALHNENQILKREVELLRRSQEQQAQHFRANDIIISGIPDPKKEDLLWYFADVTQALELEIPDVAVDSIFLTKSREQIIVKLLRSIDKQIILKRAKQYRLKGKDIGLDNHPNINIYINESLPPTTAKIFSEARKLRKDFGIKFVWHKDGKIFLKRTEEDDALCLGSLEEIKELRVHLEKHPKATTTASDATQTPMETSDATVDPRPREETKAPRPAPSLPTVTPNNEPATTDSLLPPTLKESNTIRSWASMTAQSKPPRTRKFSERNKRNKDSRSVPY